ncbi:MAG: hypothetical protein ACJ8F7_05825 [Gemmataceae bacterium]
MTRLFAATIFLLASAGAWADDAPKGPAADPAEIERLLKEIEPPPLPAPLLRGEGTRGAIARQAFDAAAMKPYLTDRLSPVDILGEPAKHPLAAATVQAGERLRKLGTGEAARLQMVVRSPITPQFKKQVLQMQKVPARILAELDDIAETLEKAGDKRAAETSLRWKAHFELLTARLRLWRVAIHEYDLMLGKIRKDELPELVAAKNENGWRIVVADKVQSGSEVKELVKEANKLLAKVGKDYPGTPWAELAKRDLALRVGLEWQPATLPGKK